MAKESVVAKKLLCIHLKELGFQHIETEYRFYADRNWRADIAILDSRILIECDGGMWTGGHKRGKALEDDYDKQNVAQMLGWRILRFSNSEVLNGKAKEFIGQWMGKGDK